jgi:hypothetical protein
MVASCPGLLSTADRAASIDGRPIIAGSHVWWMALWTQPDNLLTTALGYLVGRGIAGVPFLRKFGVIFHGAARTETATPTSTVGADYVSSVACQ